MRRSRELYANPSPLPQSLLGQRLLRRFPCGMCRDEKEGRSRRELVTLEHANLRGICSKSITGATGLELRSRGQRRRQGPPVWRGDGETAPSAVSPRPPA